MRPMSSSGRWPPASPASASTISNSSGHAGRDRRRKGRRSPSAAFRWSVLAQPPEAEARDPAHRRGTRRAAVARGPRLDGRRGAASRPARRASASQRRPRLADAPVQQALEVPCDDFCAGSPRRDGRRAFRIAAGPSGRAHCETWVDGAHNAAAAEALAALLAERGPMHLILGILANKDARGIVERARAARAVADLRAGRRSCAPRPGRASPRFGGTQPPLRSKQALAAVSGPRLVAGSLYLAGTVLGPQR